MKNNGFTLAEVLITMAIIGVIAAVTLPSLNANVNEESAITKYKKAMSALDNIGTMVSAGSEFDYSDVLVGVINDANRGYDAQGVLRRQLWAIFDRYGKIDRNATAAGRNPGGGCNNDLIQANGRVIYFKDGTALCYRQQGARNAEEDMERILAVIDINGTKGPNRLSTCDDLGCNTNRNINDQFAITLAGESAYPGHLSSLNRPNLIPVYGGGAGRTSDNASRWAYEK